MSLFRTLLIIAVIYSVIRFLTRYVFPLVVKNAASKVQENMMNKMEEIYRQQNKKNEGEITVKNTSGGKNKKGDDEGEYVAYEEVK